MHRCMAVSHSLLSWLIARRPEITILSAEPLASTSWFPGASGGFPPPPPPAAQIWGPTIPPSIQVTVFAGLSVNKLCQFVRYLGCSNPVKYVFMPWACTCCVSPHQPPPSYEEVIREKTQEQVLPPSSSLSCSVSHPAPTITTATQTDPRSAPDPKVSQGERRFMFLMASVLFIFESNLICVLPV